MNNTQRNLIKAEIRRLLKGRAATFPLPDSASRNAPFHEAVLRSFRSQISKLTADTPYLIAIASWLHGLNTTFGQSTFEKFAHILSGGVKKTFPSMVISTEQSAAIAQIIVGLKAGTRKPSIYLEDQMLNAAIETKSRLEPALPFSADNFVETEDSIDCIELKSVRPNSGEVRGEKQKILYGRAALAIAHPNKAIRFYIGFPFDPTAPPGNPTSYDKERFINHLVEFRRFFHPDEILLGPELWDHLSGGTGTMEQLLALIADVVQEQSPE